MRKSRFTEPQIMKVLKEVDFARQTHGLSLRSACETLNLNRSVYRYRTFNVLEDFNRKILAIEMDLNLPAPRVIRVLDRIVEKRAENSNNA